MTRAITLHAALWALAGFCASCSKPTAPASGTGAETDRDNGAETPTKTTGTTAEPRAHSTVTFKVENKSGADRFYFFTRSRAESLQIERRASDQWVELTFEQPICTEPCPADATTPTCQPCYPAAPLPGVGHAGKFEHFWSGLVFETLQGTQDWCFCHRTSAAPLGRYRATLTTSPKAICESEPCEYDAQGVARGTVSGDPIRGQVEFELTDTDQTVVIPLE